MTTEGRRMKKIYMTAIAVSVAVIFLMPATVAYISDAEDPVTGSLLYDKGNGFTEWYKAEGSGTIEQMLTATLTANGHTVAIAGSVVTLDGKTSKVIGGTQTSADTLRIAGLSGRTVTSNWTVYIWDGEKWAVLSDLSGAYSGGYYAVGFYPAGTVPAERPNAKAYTSIGGDAEHINHQTAEVSTDDSTIAWAYGSETEGMGGNFAVYSQILLAGGYALVKFGYNTGSEHPNSAMFSCIKLDTGEIKWFFRYTRNYYEVTTAAVVGDYVYIQSSTGFIYKINWATSSGDLSNSPDVKALCGESAPTATTVIPVETTLDIKGQDYSDGPTSLVYDSGCIFTTSSNGMVYCFDLDLYPVWSYQTHGKAYTYSPTVSEGYVFAGMLDGHMYIIDEADGTLVKDEEVFTKAWPGATSGTYYRILFEEVAADYSRTQSRLVAFTVKTKELDKFVAGANQAFTDAGIDIQFNADGTISSTTYGTDVFAWHSSGSWKLVDDPASNYTGSTFISIEAGAKGRTTDISVITDPQIQALYMDPASSGTYYRSPAMVYDQLTPIPYNYFNMIGGITQILALPDGGNVKLFTGFSDGLGMSATTYGMVAYTFNTSTHDLTRNYYDATRQVSAYMTPVKVDGKQYVYYMSSLSSITTMFRMDTETFEASRLTSGLYESHGALMLLNGNALAATTYNKNYPACMYQLDGTKTGECWIPEEYRAFCMNNIIFFDGGYLIGNDGNLMCFKGGFDTPVPLKPTEDMDLTTLWTILIIAGVLIAIFVVAYLVMRFALGWEKPIAHLIDSYNRFLHGEEYTHNTQSRHKLWIVMGVGIFLSLLIAIISLCLGPTQSMNPVDMFKSLWSAIRKGGSNLSYDELMVYSARLPRTMVALAVGIGLSVAGCMYQAIIRNPMVDPYIMGVSSGAGTAAIGVIAFNFTFFGLFPSHSIFLTAAAAGIGGIVAFFCTMALAHKAGGTSVNYVLAGVIVGLVFSAAQTLMLTFAGNNVTSALSWLYGSFSEITWKKVWIVVLPVIGISLASLFWAKEFNLVLLGEDQAKQMGLNVRKFNRWMLIIASLLTAICVAFCGIIGFVGLVIPHLCRMVLGGDHRLVLPASMAFGGALMVLADLASRMIVPGFELPVGAITTVIGVPVFAWLLIKRGKMYDG